MLKDLNGWGGESPGGRRGLHNNFSFVDPCSQHKTPGLFHGIKMRDWFLWWTNSLAPENKTCCALAFFFLLRAIKPWVNVYLCFRKVALVLSFMFSKSNAVFQMILTQMPALIGRIWVYSWGVGFSDLITNYHWWFEPVENCPCGFILVSCDSEPHQSSEKEQMDRRYTSLSFGG